MRIVVVGGGSVGLLTAARLALAGQPVALVTRSDGQADAVRREGILVRELDGRERRAWLHAFSQSQPWPEAEVYLLAVKQPALPDIVPRLKGLPAEARVIAMQNGMGHREQLLAALPGDRLFFAVNSEGARRLSPTVVEHTGRGLLRVGPWEKREREDRLVREFVAAAASAGIGALAVEAAAPLVWRKLLANACINPLTALWEVRNGELLERPERLSLMRRAFEEGAEVARREGERIGEADWEEILAICRSTSRNHSSMLQDLWSGRPTEIEAINGYLARKGREHGLAVPTHETLRRAVLLKESLRKGKGEAFHDRLE